MTNPNPFGNRLIRTLPLLLVLLVGSFWSGSCQITLAQDGVSFAAVAYPQAGEDEGTVRCIALECYVRGSDESTREQVEFLQKWVAGQPGIRLRVRDLDEGAAEAERLEKILAAYKIVDHQLPVVYGMNQVVRGPLNEEQWTSQLEKLMTMRVFGRAGCSRCAKAKAFFPTLRARYPGLRIDYQDAIENAAAGREYNELVRSQRLGGVSFPGFWFCRQLMVGFDRAETTGARLEEALRRWTFECEEPGQPDEPKTISGRSRSQVRWVSYPVPFRQETGEQEPGASSATQEPGAVDQTGEDLPLPGEVPELVLDESADVVDGKRGPSADEIDVPWFGRISATQLGMPVFTLLIGLVDGFNPCAMWVLLFLLSVLVNLRVRWKILAVAGTFVVVSGLAYLAFMAAWLNVFLLVGYLRWVQILLASLAIFVGSVHVKDFFAFKRGLTLSIPDSAKPGIYARVRRIVMAEHLYGAIAGAFVLAVLVNVVELLCTAGLPALYSQVLMLQDYPAWKNYAYLGLYIVAYMLDDSIMVGIVVLTLGKRKLQEHEGRWLKLVSGLVILALGLVLLFRPDWLG